MDTIWNVAYGVDKDMQNDMDNEYFYVCEKHFNDASKFKPIVYISGLLTCVDHR
jgi:hypothetical protein